MKLHNNNKTTILRGDIPDALYWQTKYAALRLDAAISTGQPDGAVRELIAPVINGCAEVLKEHPHHEEVRQWQKKALLLRGRISLNALPAVFSPGFAHWVDPSYEAGWRQYHLAKSSLASEYWGWARSFAANALGHFNVLHDRMETWPVEVQEWIAGATAEMQAAREEADKIVREHIREHEELREIVSGGA